MIIPITKDMTYEQAAEVYDENTRSLFAPGLNGGMVLVIDVTGSMASIIRSLTKNLTGYADVMFKGQIDRLGLVCMDDHYLHRSSAESKENERIMAARGASPAVKFQKSTRDPEEYKRWLGDYPRGSGDDEPEAWACAIDHARRLDPEANIWLCTDAPPHGAKWGGGSGDFYPEGCPCGIELDLTGVTFVDFRYGAGNRFLPWELSYGVTESARRFQAKEPIGPDLAWSTTGLHKKLIKANPDAMIPFSIQELEFAFNKYLGGK